MATLRQESTLFISNGATAADPVWPAATLAGSLLVARIWSRNEDEVPTWTPPSGWTLAVAPASAMDYPQCRIYYIEASASRSSTESFGHDGSSKPVAGYLQEWEPGAGETITLDQVASAIVAAGAAADTPTGTTPTTAGPTIQVGMAAVRNQIRTLSSIQDSFTEKVNATTTHATNFSGMRIAAGDKIEASAEAAATGWTVNNVNGSNRTGAIATFLIGEDGGGTAHEVDVNDSVALADTIAKARGPAVTDTVALADALARTAEYERTVADTVALADAVALSRTLTVAETLALADEASPVSGLGVTIDDTLALADAVALAHGKGVSDTVTLADAITLGRALVIADTVSAQDTIGRVVDYLRTLADTAGLADNTTTAGAGGHTLLVEDTVGLADAVTLARTMLLADPVAVADALAKTRGLALTNTLPLADALSLARTLALADAVAVIDAITSSAIPPQALAQGALRLIRAEAAAALVRADGPVTIIRGDGPTLVR